MFSEKKKNSISECFFCFIVYGFSDLIKGKTFAIYYIPNILTIKVIL